MTAVTACRAIERVGEAAAALPTTSQGATVDEQMLNKVANDEGFIAALDQSGGSTPKALKLYGIDEDAYSGDDAMFDLIHQMRSRIITSSSLQRRPGARRHPLRADHGP